MENNQIVEEVTNQLKSNFDTSDMSEEYIRDLAEIMIEDYNEDYE